MKTTNRFVSIGITLVAIAMVLLLVKNIATPAGSATGLTGFAAPVEHANGTPQ